MDYALEQVMNRTGGMEQGKKNYYTDQIEYFVVSRNIYSRIYQLQQALLLPCGSWFA